MSKRRYPLNKFVRLLENPSPNLSVDVYNEKENAVRRLSVKKPKKEKMTLAKLAEKMDNNFNELKQDIKDINARIDRIDARLDYNGLKKLPGSK